MGRRAPQRRRARRHIVDLDEADRLRHARVSEHRAIARIPEFRCKYPDFGLPNECRTTWRTVYADVPVAVIRRDHVDIDVPQWQWRDAHTTVDVPRLVWKEQQLVVSLPAVAVRPDPAR